MILIIQIVNFIFMLKLSLCYVTFIQKNKALLKKVLKNKKKYASNHHSFCVLSLLLCFYIIIISTQSFRTMVDLSINLKMKEEKHHLFYTNVYFSI